MNINNILNDIERKKVKYENVVKQLHMKGLVSDRNFASGIVSGLSFAETIIKEHMKPEDGSW